MKCPACYLLLPLFQLGAATTQTQAPAPKPGYSVVLEITFAAQGAPKKAKGV